MSIGRYLKQVRESRHLSMSELARRAKVSKSLVSRLEAGGGGLKVDSLRALSDALSIPHGELLNFVEVSALPYTIVEASEAIEAAKNFDEYVRALIALQDAVKDVRMNRVYP